MLPFFASMLSFAPLAALSLLWGSAHAIRANSGDAGSSLLQAEAGDLDLTGLWVQKRNIFGYNLRKDRIWDVIKTGSGFTAFPIGGCRESVLSLGVGILCDEVVSIAIVEKIDSVTYLSMSKRLADGSNSPIFWANAEAVRFDNGTVEVRFDDSLPWLRPATEGENSILAQALSKWDAPECRALDGASGAAPMAYELLFGISASLSFRNIPGVTLDSFACMASEWLSAHSERFDCILKNAAKNETDGEGGLGQEELEKVLGKLKSVMPQDGETLCIPTVCLGASVVKAPVPSPVPTLSLFLTWPFNLRNCNGMSLQAEIESMQQAQNGPDLSKVDEIEHSTFQAGATHGLSFGLFPVPDQAYFIMGTAGAHGLLSSLFGGARNRLEQPFEILAEDIKKSSGKLVEAVQEAVNSCSEVKMRYQYYEAAVRVSGEVKMGSDEEWQAVLKAFPEIRTVEAPRTNGGLSMTGGGYLQVGWTGGATGVFAGGGVNSQALGKQFMGCPAWKTVIKLWYDSPLAFLPVLPAEEESEVASILSMIREASPKSALLQLDE